MRCERALTLEQVLRLELPSTPLKETEKRADRWRLVMGHEQTEIDALAALNPDALREIAFEALQPFYDPTLEGRVRAAEARWYRAAEQMLTTHPAYELARDEVEAALSEVQAATHALDEAQDNARLKPHRARYPLR